MGSVLHIHRLCDEWETLKDKVLDFMTQFRGGSQAFYAIRIITELIN